MPDAPRPPADLLAEAYARSAVVDGEGVERAINSQIPPAYARALTETVRREQPNLVVEIGMACGFSSLAILSALPENGRLVSVDPYHGDYHRIGETLVCRSTRAASHQLVEEPDYLALPRMVEQGWQVDMAYIDGMHTFDYVALDAFYLDKLLRVGGVLAFNDCGFRSINKFLKYFVNHRHYEEIDVGLTPDYRGRNPLVTAWRRLEKRSSHDRYFRKLDSWEPEHTFFRNF